VSVGGKRDASLGHAREFVFSVYQVFFKKIYLKKNQINLFLNIFYNFNI